MTSSIENSAKSIESVPGASNIEKSYRICKTTVAYGGMVGCDKCDQWFLPKCIKLVLVLPFMQEKKCSNQVAKNSTPKTLGYIHWRLK